MYNGATIHFNSGQKHTATATMKSFTLTPQNKSQCNWYEKICIRVCSGKTSTLLFTVLLNYYAKTVRSAQLEDMDPTGMKNMVLQIIDSQAWRQMDATLFKLEFYL